MTLPQDLERRVARFEKYLREADSRSVLEHGYASFHYLRDHIRDGLHPWPEHAGPSGLGWEEEDDAVEMFAWNLGQDLMEHCEKLWVKASRIKFDHHKVRELGILADLAWQIMYYNEG